MVVNADEFAGYSIIVWYERSCDDPVNLVSNMVVVKAAASENAVLPQTHLLISRILCLCC